ncbi:MAG: ASKHA domain-containing protein [Bacillota bacterium]
MHKVTFLPDKKSGYFPKGTSLRDAALELGIVIESSCGGAGTCGKCKVIISGAAGGESRPEEKISKEDYSLSCKEQVWQDTICYVPETSRTIKEQIMTEGKSGIFRLDPDIKKIFLKVAEPQLGEKYFDLDEVIKALNKSSVKVTDYSFKAATEVSEALRESSYRVTAVVDRKKLISIEPGDTTKIFYGIAVDVGTTTIALKLLNISTGEVSAVASALNRQQFYGADVISRINYIISNPDGLQTLHTLVITQINELTEEVCNSAGIRSSDIYKAVIAGNTVMQHILLKLDPRNLAFMPYIPVIQGPVSIAAEDLEVKINNHGILWVMPNLGGFVGSDITSVLTMLDLEKSESMQLVIDIGTNGEIALGSKERVICASSPAGPAWEGASITNGMRAANGAIEAAEISNGKLITRTIGNTEPKGICGSGLCDLVIEFLRAGVIDKGGRIVSPEELTSEGKNQGELSSENLNSKALNSDKALNSKVMDGLKGRITNNENGSNDINIFDNKIILSQKDIREVQLAKAAISAGIKILMKEMNVNPVDLSVIYVAGAFGNHISSTGAIEMGLLPKVNEDKVKFIGNAALSGAESVLLSSEARIKAERLANTVEYIEISGREDFQEIFIDSMMF